MSGTEARPAAPIRVACPCCGPQPPKPADHAFNINHPDNALVGLAGLFMVVEQRQRVARGGAPFGCRPETTS